ncbi:MAG: hypothetical protein ACOX2P_08740 [Bacillota bacterium]|jgi:hypothetical protein
MQRICPVCNGIVALAVSCPDCGKYMEDLGHVSDYFGPYSPYEENFWPASNSQVLRSVSGNCVHFLQCPQCQRCTSRWVSKIMA